jgi:hypothetical protein
MFHQVGGMAALCGTQQTGHRYEIERTIAGTPSKATAGGRVIVDAKRLCFMLFFACAWMVFLVELA